MVAVPARNEAERIPACLQALAAQVDAAGDPLPADAFEVVVLANNCTDDTARVARSAGVRLGLALQVLEVEHPPEQAHAGGARRAAMDAAADRLERAGAPGGAVLTTDADSRPRPDWLCLTLLALEAGADAVAGMVDLDAGEAGEGRRPLGASGLHGPEAEYADLLAEIASRLDPLPYDPWPNHIWTWGANLAVRADVYRAVGGLPRRRWPRTAPSPTCWSAATCACAARARCASGPPRASAAAPPAAWRICWRGAPGPTIRATRRWSPPPPPSAAPWPAVAPAPPTASARASARLGRGRRRARPASRAAA